jgi:serine/threonine protein kinase
MAGFSRALDFLRRLGGGTRDAPQADPDCVFSECPRCGRCTETSVRTCPDDGAPMGRSSDIPLILDRRYRFERLLGRGGMGSVYRGQDLTLDRPVAIKLIRAGLVRHAAAEARLLREARTLSRLTHPSIVAIHDYGTLADRSAYLVMELVAGHDLRHELVTAGRLEPGRASRILSAICGAMAAAHEARILHCDLKPENVLLPGEGVEAKVLDFGMAQAIGAGTGARAVRPCAELGGGFATIDEPIVGTPAYMAPEQLRGEPPDGRTDVFSLGVIAYEMLLGDLPFGGGSAAEVALAQARGLPAAPATLPAAWSRAVQAALALDADRRPPSPQALAYLIGAATGAR